MSNEKKLPPIQPAPFQRFTVRLVDGHFVRVPKLENIATTDATRPPTALPPGAARAQAAKEGGRPIPRTMRLVDGRFVRRSDLAADRSSAPATPAPATPPPAPAASPTPAAGTKARPTEPWAVTFGTRLDPSDSPTEP